MLQTTLGVFTVLTSSGISPYEWNTFEWMAQLHQLIAIFLLLSLLHAAFLLTPKQKELIRLMFFDGLTYEQVAATTSQRA